MSLAGFEDVTRAMIFDAIRTGECPVCGSGPHKSLANHIFKQHGVTAPAIKAAYGINRRTALQSAESRQLHARRQADHLSRDADHLAILVATQRANVRHGVNILPIRAEGRDHLVASNGPRARMLAQMYPQHPDALRRRRAEWWDHISERDRDTWSDRQRSGSRAWAAKNGPVLKKNIARALERNKILLSDPDWCDKNLYGIPRAEWAGIASRRDAGEGRASIAKDYGCCTATVTNVVRRFRAVTT